MKGLPEQHPSSRAPDVRYSAVHAVGERRNSARSRYNRKGYPACNAAFFIRVECAQQDAAARSKFAEGGVIRDGPAAIVRLSIL